MPDPTAARAAIKQLLAPPDDTGPTTTEETLMPDQSFTEARADDRALITALAHRYAPHRPRQDGLRGHAPGLSTEDANLVLPDGTAVPPADLAQVLQGDEAAYIRHHITTVDIRFAGPGEATADVFFLRHHQRSDPRSLGLLG